MNFKWTVEKVDLLREFYPNTEWEELYEILGTKNKSSILSMASKYGINRKLYNDCHANKNEVDFIISNHSNMTASEMGRYLGRNTTFVCRIMNKLGLSMKERGIYKEDVELFKKIYPLYTNKYLHERYFPYLTTGQLRKQAEKFGLVKSPEKSIKWYDKEQILIDLKKSIDQYGRVPYLIELQSWGLPSEKTFVRYFGSLDNACKLIGIERPNYSKPITLKNGVLFDNKGNPCFSNAEVLISNFLIQLNIEFEKEYYYKNIMPVEECKDKRFDWKIGDKYIEFFGLTGYGDYDKKTQIKIDLCSKYKVDLLPLYNHDLSSSKWKNKILNFLNK